MSDLLQKTILTPDIISGFEELHDSKEYHVVGKSGREYFWYGSVIKRNVEGLTHIYLPPPIQNEVEDKIFRCEKYEDMEGDGKKCEKRCGHC